MKALLHYISSELVDDPGAVSVREVPGPRETRLEVRVAGEDIGRLIGKQGRTVRALRTLLDLGGRKARRRYVLEIME
jgi:hypothetical protein